MEMPENTGLHEEMTRLKGDNYRLNRTIKRLRNEAKGRDKYIRELEKEIKQLKKKK
jgi:hypothetical protein